MKVLQVAPWFYPAFAYGGPVESVYQLCRRLAGSGCMVRVLTTDAAGPTELLGVQPERAVEVAEGVHVRYCHRVMCHSVSPSLLRLLPAHVRWADIVHLNAVYSFPTIPTLIACRLLDKPVVWSTRGALQRWDRSTRRRRKMVWESMCLASAPQRLMLHATSDEEAESSRRQLGRFKTVVIPNGVEIPKSINHVPGDGVLRLLYVGRLHPIKGIENLLAACGMLREWSRGGWVLAIAGTGDARYTASIVERIHALSLSGRVQMLAGVYGAAKTRLFETADVVVIPSHRESFSVVAAEALAHSVPVIASTGTPWKKLEELNCGLWVSNEPASLASAIDRLSRMPLREMGRRGRDWMEKEFNWETVTADFRNLYSEVALC